ncbi:MAG: hypothetical protein ACK53C_16670, partial [Pseudomonadota bacterium]
MTTAMPIVPGDQDREFTASDILSPQRWSSTASRAVFGLDVTCTKFAVVFQKLSAGGAIRVVRAHLDLLRAAAGLGSV